MISKTKKIYLFAHDKYTRAEEIVKEMCKGNDEAFFRSAMKNFDVFLQCLLYRAAIVDKRFVKTERSFLMDITEYEDVPALVKAKKTFNAKADADLLGELEEAAENASSAFVSAFAKVDADDKERDFLFELEQLITDIFFCFAEIDGDDLEKTSSRDDVLSGELDVLAHSLGAYFTQKWEALVSAFEQQS